MWRLRGTRRHGGHRRAQTEINVVGIVPSAENLLGAGSYRPGDIVTAYDGKHIEVINTDAEGRVVSADAHRLRREGREGGADYRRQRGRRDHVVVMGDHVAGLWTNSKTMRTGLLDAAERAGEKLWHMPLFPEYEEQIRSQIALIKNSSGRPGGANNRRHLPQDFCRRNRGLHLDIAGAAAEGERRAAPAGIDRFRRAYAARILSAM